MYYRWKRDAQQMAIQIHWYWTIWKGSVETVLNLAIRNQTRMMYYVLVKVKTRFLAFYLQYYYTADMLLRSSLPAPAPPAARSGGATGVRWTWRRGCRSVDLPTAWVAARVAGAVRAPKVAFGSRIQPGLALKWCAAAMASRRWRMMCHRPAAVLPQRAGKTPPVALAVGVGASPVAGRPFSKAEETPGI